MIVALKLRTAAVPRLLKWIGRSPVERAAAAFFPDVKTDYLVPSQARSHKT